MEPEHAIGILLLLAILGGTGLFVTWATCDEVSDL